MVHAHLACSQSRQGHGPQAGVCVSSEPWFSLPSEAFAIFPGEGVRVLLKPKNKREKEINAGVMLCPEVHKAHPPQQSYSNDLHHIAFFIIFIELFSVMLHRIASNIVLVASVFISHEMEWLPV